MKPPAWRWGLAVVLASALWCSVGLQHAAEGLGGIRGTVYEADLGVPLAGVRVSAVGPTTTAALTSSDGTFLIQGLAPGSYSVTFSKTGFERMLRSDVLVRPGELADVSGIELAPEIVEMEEVVVTGTDLLAGSETALLEIRQTAVALTEGISAELISQAGASDVSAVLPLVTGVSVAEGKYATVRGLSDRYTGTTLNGVRVPSADPRRKAVQIDLFPTQAVQDVVVTKTFTPNLQGDFTGGGVDIKTAGVPDRFFISATVATEYDTDATNSEFLTYKGGGVEPTGFAGTDRKQPAVPHFVKDWAEIRFVRNNQAAQYPVDVQAAQQYDQFTRAMAPAMGVSREDGRMNTGFSISSGTAYSVGSGRLGVVGAISQRRGFDQYEDGQNNGGIVSTPDGGIVLKTPRTDHQGKDEVLLGLLGTLAWQPNERHELSFTLVGSQGAEDEARIQTTPRAARTVEVNQTLHYTERSLASAQLRGEHTFPRLFSGDAFTDMLVSWRLSYNFTRQDEPDVRFFRTGQSYVDLDGDGITDLLDFRWEAAGAPTSTPRERSRRIFSNIEEGGLQGAVDVTFPFSTWTAKPASFKAGLFADSRDREYVKTGYYWNFPNGARFAPHNGTLDERIVQRCNQTKISATSTDLDALWTDVFTAPDRIGLAPPTEPDCVGSGSTDPLPNYAANQLLWTVVQDYQEDVSYDATEKIFAAYAMTDVPVTAKLSLTAGARLEDTDISIDPAGSLFIVVEEDGARTTRPASPSEVATDLSDSQLLPSVSLAYELKSNMLLRGAWSRTLARPTFRELGPVLTEEFIFGDVFLGEPTLSMSKITNYDLRWEWFRRPGDVLAASLFYKDIEDPIELINFALSSGSETSYKTPTNYDHGSVEGYELEARTGLDVLWKGLKDLALGANYARLDSKVEIPPDEYLSLAGAGLEQQERQLYAQPAFTFNANLTYGNERSGTRAGVFYNRLGDTLLSGAAAGPDSKPDVFELEYDSLDATFQQRLLRTKGGQLTLALKARNLTRPTRTQVYRLPRTRYDVSGQALPLEEIYKQRETASRFGVSLSWFF
jgi:TonB-dependent receptor